MLLTVNRIILEYKSLRILKSLINVKPNINIYINKRFLGENRALMLILINVQQKIATLMHPSEFIIGFLENFFIKFYPLFL